MTYSLPEFRYEILYTRKGYGQELFNQYIIANCQSQAVIMFVNAYFRRNNVFQIVDVDLSQHHYDKQLKAIEEKERAAS